MKASLPLASEFTVVHRRPSSRNAFRMIGVGLLGLTLCCATVGRAQERPIPAAELPKPSQAVIVDHTYANLGAIPVQWIEAAKAKLVIAYGHTSHGSQLVSGLEGLEKWKKAPYLLHRDDQRGGLKLLDTPFEGADDLGNPDRTAWAGATRKYLKAHPEVNVVMWSWCGQVSDSTEADISGYLNRMSQLEKEFPKVRFVYFTGHLDGSGVNGNLNKRNEQIRAFAKKNGKVLYDFADIETFDPNGKGYMAKNVNDECNYDGGNWAIEWQKANPGKWYEVEAAHSQPLNGNLKAYAAWSLFARLAGWQGK